MNRGVKERPNFCRTCGEALVETPHGYDEGFDDHTGEPKGRREWASLDCPNRHIHWRFLKDAWYAG